MNFTSNQPSTGKNKSDHDHIILGNVSEDTFELGHKNTSDSLEQDLATAAVSSQAEAGYWKHRKEIRERLKSQTDTRLKSLTAPHLRALTQLVENYSEAIEETTSFSRAQAQHSILRTDFHVVPDQTEVLAMIVGTGEQMDSSTLKKRQLALAESSGATVDILEELAVSSFPEVREAVADHKNCSASILLILAEDETIEVRYALAENHNLPFQVLEKLSQDENPYVAYRAERTMRRILFDNVICMEIPRDDEGEEQNAATG